MFDFFLVARKYHLFFFMFLLIFLIPTSLCFYYEHGAFGLGVLADYTMDMTAVRSVFCNRTWKWIQRALALRTRKDGDGPGILWVGNGDEQTDRTGIETRFAYRVHSYIVLNSNESKLKPLNYFFPGVTAALAQKDDDSGAE
jgi:hypothetical protein